MRDRGSLRRNRRQRSTRWCCHSTDGRRAACGRRPSLGEDIVVLLPRGACCVTAIASSRRTAGSFASRRRPEAVSRVDVERCRCCSRAPRTTSAIVTSRSRSSRGRSRICTTTCSTTWCESSGSTVTRRTAPLRAGSRRVRRAAATAIARPRRMPARRLRTITITTTTTTTITTTIAVTDSGARRLAACGLGETALLRLLAAREPRAADRRVRVLAGPRVRGRARLGPRRSDGARLDLRPAGRRPWRARRRRCSSARTRRCPTATPSASSKLSALPRREPRNGGASRRGPPSRPAPRARAREPRRRRGGAWIDRDDATYATLFALAAVHVGCAAARAALAFLFAWTEAQVGAAHAARPARPDRGAARRFRSDGHGDPRGHRARARSRRRRHRLSRAGPGRRERPARNPVHVGSSDR